MMKHLKFLATLLIAFSLILAFANIASANLVETKDLERVIVPGANVLKVPEFKDKFGKTVASSMSNNLTKWLKDDLKTRVLFGKLVDMFGRNAHYELKGDDIVILLTFTEVFYLVDESVTTSGDVKPLGNRMFFVEAPYLYNDLDKVDLDNLTSTNNLKTKKDSSIIMKFRSDDELLSLGLKRSGNGVSESRERLFATVSKKDLYLLEDSEDFFVTMLSLIKKLEFQHKAGIFVVEPQKLIAPEN